MERKKMPWLTTINNLRAQSIFFFFIPFTFQQLWPACSYNMAEAARETLGGLPEVLGGGCLSQHGRTLLLTTSRRGPRRRNIITVQYGHAQAQLHSCNDNEGRRGARGETYSDLLTWSAISAVIFVQIIRE